MLMASCKDEDDVISPAGDPALELSSIDAVVGMAETRATANNDYIGRNRFVADDRMVLTRMQRTEKPLADFSYAGVNLTYSGSAWSRDASDRQPDRLYWSDNASPHTFIGYSLPQNWGTPAQAQENGKWVNTSDIYSGQFSYTVEGDKKVVDFSARESDLKDILDSKKQSTGQQIDSTGYRLKQEDLLLTHSTRMFADPGGLTTTLHYRHALASLRVIIDIQGFAPSTYAEDVKTTIDSMVILNQPYKYTWHNAITDTPFYMTDGTVIPGWGVANSTAEADGTVDIMAWQPRPSGEGNGQAKIFTFYSLIVPGKQQGFTINYKVHYPNHLDPDKIVNKNYRASLLDADSKPVTINFLPGYTTTIRVSLNHEGEPVYIGAEYIDWEDIDVPDRGDLQMLDIFLDTDKRTDITIVGDAKATKDDATWLYKNNNDTIDIYGHKGTPPNPATGTPADPYIIKTARQFLSFAYEVKNGNTFEGKYIKLDTDIYLQKSLTDTDITWPSIGDADHPFNGVFLGDSRYIHYLNGQPLFHTIGEYAVVDKVNFSHVLNVTGSGVVANVNNGLLAGCNVEGNIEQAKPTGSGDSYCGSFVGDNQSFIVACTHVGDVTGYGYVGGLVGRNAGALVASYHAGNVSYAADATDAQKVNIGGSTGLKDLVRSIVFSCYQNGDLATHDPNLLYCRAAWPLTTLQMQSEDFVKSNLDDPFNIGVTTTAEGDPYVPYIAGTIDGDPFGPQYHYSLNTALQKFSAWVNQKAVEAAETGHPVVLPCHTFSARQVQVLNGLFSKTANGELVPAHLYKYSPGTYPRIQ